MPHPVAVISATTLDSRSVTVSYEVTSPAPGESITFGVFRSASSRFDPSAIPVGLPVAVPAVDASGHPSGAPGVHLVSLPIAGGLPINPKHPYVLVVADPGSPSASDPGESASFRKVVLGVITHGGLEYDHWKKHGPPWELEMARSLRDQGYDSVIAYNWVSQSNTPGSAAKQGPILASRVLDAASKFPSADPVDIQFIGHSEGAVVNTLAIARVEAAASPRIRAGYLQDTLLDPHAANPDYPGRQYSVGGPLAWVAKLAIDNYQARARDPLVFIPRGVDSAQVFYQQTPADQAHNENLGMYNLWGQAPVKGPADYFNLTTAGVVHSGKRGVYAWYEHHVVPTLGDGAPAIARETLTGRLANPTAPGGDAVASARATYTGKTAPGATVSLLAGGAGPSRLRVVGRGVAGPDGRWAATTGPLAEGRYRVVAEARLPAAYPGDRPPVPTAPLGLLAVRG